MSYWTFAALGAGFGLSATLLAWARYGSGISLAPNGFSGNSTSPSKSEFGARGSLLAIGALVVILSSAIPSLQVLELGISASAPAAQGIARPSAEIAKADADIARIEDYLAKVGRAAPPSQSPMPQAAEGGLPDVDTMIVRLAERLAQSPNDVDGWRTLGWSYRNTGRMAEAVAAYAKAAALAPDRTDISEALTEARTEFGVAAASASAK